MIPFAAVIVLAINTVYTPLKLLCSYKNFYEEQIFPFIPADINLPLAPDSLRYSDIDPFSSTITINSAGKISICDTFLSIDQLEKMLVSKHQRIGRYYPVLIAANSNIDFGKIWPVVSMCRRLGIWRFHFLVLINNPSQEPRQISWMTPHKQFGTLSFSAPVEENQTKYKGPVILKTEGEPFFFCKLEVTTDNIKFNGKDISLPDLDAYFGSSSEINKLTSIIILPVGDVPYSSIINVLNICSKHELRNICIMEELGADPIEPPLEPPDPMQVLQI
ncbi:ExbD/TolR family protein [Verrucomicrobiota bacterium]